MNHQDYLVLDRNIADKACHLTAQLSIAKDSVYFDGHFDEFAILPAVVQLFFVQQIATAEFGELGRFHSLNQVKFKALVKPDSVLQLSLNYDKSKGILTFHYQREAVSVSSGKLKYQTI